MRSRMLVISVVAVVLAITAAVPGFTTGQVWAQAPARVQIEFWHAMRGPLGESLEGIAARFNASQTRYKVNPTFKGSYPETMVAAIAAFRAGNAPHIVQMFEVGTATMMAAGAAIKPVHQLFKETGVSFDPTTYLPAVRGYYSDAAGRMVCMPFNSSTPVLWYNKDAFRKAGLDPNTPPKTWAQVRTAAQRIRATNAAPCGLSTAWPTWVQFETFGAVHDIPLATKANGFEGFDAELTINAPLYVRHVQLLMDMLKEGTFKYGGRDSAGDAVFPSPRRTPEEYRGVAELFRFLSSSEEAAKWHQETGYVPITFSGMQQAMATGYYREFPWAELPIKQLTRTPPTKNSRGVRLGNMPEIRVVIYEEIEKAFQGQQTAKQALDNAVRRGNEILRRFQQTVGQ